MEKLNAQSLKHLSKRASRRNRGKEKSLRILQNQQKEQEQQKETKIQQLKLELGAAFVALETNYSFEDYKEIMYLSDPDRDSFKMLSIYQNLQNEGYFTHAEAIKCAGDLLYTLNQTDLIRHKIERLKKAKSNHPHFKLPDYTDKKAWMEHQKNLIQHLLKLRNLCEKLAGFEKL